MLLKKVGLGGPIGRAQAPSYASITWIRFNGSFAFRAKLSAFAPPAGQVGSPNIV